jgi:putative aldouronate transport system substrate-binding protein
MKKGVVNVVKNSVKLLAVFLIATSIFGTVCFGAVPAEAAGNHPFTPGATINVMIMPQGDMNSATVKEVTTAVNNRIKALGYNFKVKFSFSGGAWGFEALDEALSSGNNIPDIFPSHSWSGVFSYANAAKEGFLLRLDDPKDNLLTQFGSKLYGNASYTVKEAASVIGKQGYGTYGYIIEKDSVSQNGYLVNETVLKQLGFTLADINPKDISSWDPILKAYKKKYPNKYPLNVEADVMDRANNYIAFVDGSVSTLGYFFSGTDKANKIQSRYESNAYKSYLSQMQKFYKAGYIHPDLAITGETSSYRIAATRESGDYLISTFVYVPGYETVYSQSAT